MPRTTKPPSYRYHKATGQAVVTMAGKDFYLGRYGTRASRNRYDRVIGEWLTNGRSLPEPTDKRPTLSLNELILSYGKHACRYYVKDGRPTSEQSSIKCAMRSLRRLYGETPALEFGPLKLQAVRRHMIQPLGWSRKYINDQVDRIRRMFKWSVSRELIPSSVYEALRAVEGLKRGRSEARDTRPVKSVPLAFVKAIRPFVSREVWGSVQIQLLTGCRPGEATTMRGTDLDMAGRIWTYTPASHKTEHHEKRRVIYLGPKAQVVVREFLKPDLSAHLFSAADAEDTRNARRRRLRQAPMTPSHRKRAGAAKHRKRRCPPRGHYDVASYRRAIARACDSADAAAKKAKGLPPDSERVISRWHPHQLRHTAATRLRKEFGVEAARIILGHSSPTMTDLYAELDEARALEVMAKIG